MHAAEGQDKAESSIKRARDRVAGRPSSG